MKHIAILSDTHGLLRECVKAELEVADLILHAGDIDNPIVLEAMQRYGETYVVRGNNDKEWAEYLPLNLTITIEGVRFLLVHNKKDIPKNLKDVDVVIYGHSHKYFTEVINGVLFLNPGSCGRRRFKLDITMCRMFVNEGKYEYEEVVLPLDSTQR